MMWISIHKFTSILLLVPVVQSILPPFTMPKKLDKLNEKIIHEMFEYCPEHKWYTQTYLKKFVDKVTQKYDNLKLYHFAGRKFISHNLYEAHLTIPKIPSFVPNGPMEVIIPGLYHTIITPMDLIKKFSFLRKSNIFVLHHDYVTSNLLDNIYFNSKFAGNMLGIALSRFYKNGVKNFRCIGYSLGCQLCGFVGKKFKELTNQTLDRISALDPGGLCFNSQSSENRLDKSDAKFVDVVFTNFNRIGYRMSLGHVNFYPNGGTNMYYCLLDACSHLTVVFYYIESIYSKNFLAVRCTDYETFKSGACYKNKRAIMGYWTPIDTAHGDYFLFVKSTPKFALGENGIAKPDFNIRKFWSK